MRELGDHTKSDDTFPDEYVLAASQDLILWFEGFANYLDSGIIPPDMSFNQRKKFMYDMNKFFWDEPYLYRSCGNGLIKRCVPEVEMLSVLDACHSSPVGGHHSGIKTIHKILQCGYYWPTIHQDDLEFAKACDRCQRDSGISRMQELPLNPILVIELFDVWGNEFMGPFVNSHGMKYILVAVNYVSKSVKAIALANNKGKSVTVFLKMNIFSQFCTPRDTISDGGSHFLQQIF